MLFGVSLDGFGVDFAFATIFFAVLLAAVAATNVEDATTRSMMLIESLFLLACDEVSCSIFHSVDLLTNEATILSAEGITHCR